MCYVATQKCHEKVLGQQQLKSSEAWELMAVQSARVAQENVVYIVATTVLVFKFKLSLPPTQGCFSRLLPQLKGRKGRNESSSQPLLIPIEETFSTLTIDPTLASRQLTQWHLCEQQPYSHR